LCLSRLEVGLAQRVGWGGRGGGGGGGVGGGGGRGGGSGGGGFGTRLSRVRPANKELA